MRKLTIAEADVVAGGYFGLDGRDAPVEDGPLEEVTVPGQRPKKDPFQGFANLPIEVYDFGLAVGFYGGGGGAGGGEKSPLEEVVVEAEKILSDNLKVDLGKCGYPANFLFNPPDKIDAAEAWKKCFDVLTDADKANLKEALKELNKVLSEKRLATSVAGNWIKQMINALDANNGGWFGQNLYDAVKSSHWGPVFAVLRGVVR